MGELKYVPALSTSFMDIKGHIEVGDKKFSTQWWRDDCFFKYNALLVSAFYGMKVGFNFRELLDIKKDTLLIVDSGGYQVIRQNAWIEPIELIKWQEKNADICLILDNPPYYMDITKVEDRIISEQESFDRGLERTLRFTEIMERNKTSDTLKVYNVLHGVTVKDMKFWYEKMSRFKFNGWALSMHPPAPMRAGVISSLIYTLEQPESVHFLLGSGFNTMPVVVYASKRLFKSTTLDSLSYHAHGFRQQYVLPWGLGHDVYDYGWKKDNEKIQLPCPCPVCKEMTIEQMTASPLGGRPLSLHNLWLSIQYTEFLKALCQNEERYKNYINNNYPEEVSKAIAFIDMTLEDGFEKAYYHFLKDIEESVPEQKKTLKGVLG